MVFKIFNLNLTFWYFKLWLPLKNWSWSPGPQLDTIRYKSSVFESYCITIYIINVLISIVEDTQVQGPETPGVTEVS